MNPIKSEGELRKQVEKCFIDNNMCDCGETHTKLSLDETEFFDVEKVVTDITHLITALQRQHERELVEAAVMGARFGNAAFRQQSIAAPGKRINLDLVLESGIKQAKDWVSRQV